MKAESLISVAPVLALAVLLFIPFTAAAAEAPDVPVAGTPQPHWSHLPIWGVEAEARGFQLPLPFGIGVNFYEENQPFNINDLQVAIGGRDPVSVKDYAVIDQVDTRQQSVAARIDAWIFPFLNFYGVAGHSSGEMNGTIGLPTLPNLGIPSQILPLSISYEGPTYGGGATLAGGFKASEWRDLTVFVVADANYTITDLSFRDERLSTDTKIKALIFHSKTWFARPDFKEMHAGIWAGAMYQDVSEFLAGQAADGSFSFVVEQEPANPWNALVGGRLEVGRHLDFIVEGGLGTRSSILGGVTFRF